MKLLLDTSTFLWLCSDDPRLTSTAKKLYLDQNNEIFLSVISALEIAIKCSINKLSLPEDPPIYIRSRRELMGIESLPLDEIAASSVYKLPLVHKDPFDRLLVSQAIYGGLTIVSNDPEIQKYPCSIVWE